MYTAIVTAQSADVLPAFGVHAGASGSPRG